MKKTVLFLILVFIGLSFSIYGQHSNRFEVKNGNFYLNDSVINIHSGEMHYPRVPRAYWKHRMEMMKAMGLNTVTTYVFWNYHEEKPGVWNWKGEKDLTAFIQTAQEVGLYVIVRPGPYVCAEWDFGGYPWWLSNVTGLEIRTYNKPFLDACKNYMNELGKQVVPLQIHRGGPVIMVQVENEFGFYVSQQTSVPIEEHQKYLAEIKTMIDEAGIEVPLFTSDVTYLFKEGNVKGALPTANGETNITQLKHKVNEQNGGVGPYMVAEYYPGWLMHWAEPFPNVSTEKVVTDTKNFLENNVSFNYYMVHGGTNFGFYAGANYDGNHDIQPDLTSYDYDAPINEPGWDTPKYHAIRAVFEKYHSKKLPPVPARIPVIELPKVTFSREMNFFDLVNNTVPKESQNLKSFEDLNQGFGYVLYRLIVTEAMSGDLNVPGLRDYATVYVNQQFVGVLNRYYKTYSHPVFLKAGDTLDLLVEGMGRINWGAEIIHNTKGIIFPVKLNDTELQGIWKMYQFPFEQFPKVTQSKQLIENKTPVLKQATFKLKKVGDVFLDMRDFGKGVVFVNGKNIGKYWSEVGPQQTLYLPGAWLKKGKNTLTIFEQLKTTDTPAIHSCNEPILKNLKVGK